MQSIKHAKVIFLAISLHSIFDLLRIDRTTIVIAHRLTTIQNAHQIYVLEDGNAVEKGTHKTLITKQGGKYQTMVRRQQAERKPSEILLDMDLESEENQQAICMLIILFL